MGNFSARNGKHSAKLAKSVAPTPSTMMTTMCDSFSWRSNLHHLQEQQLITDSWW